MVKIPILIMPKKEKLPQKSRQIRPIRDNSYEARMALASVPPSALKPEHLSVEEQIKRHEARGEHRLAKILREREAERKRKQSPTEQIPLDVGTERKPEQGPQQATLNLPTEVLAKDKTEEKLIANLVRKTLAKMRPSGHRTRWIDEKTAATVIVNADNPLRPPLEKERLIGLVATEAQLRRAAKLDAQ